jgi:hypothetical protein
MSVQNDLRLIKQVIAKLDSNRVSRFSYTDAAFDNDDVGGVEVFDKDAGQNIPLAGLTDYAEKVLDKGVRAQGASIPRMGWNHFLGRMSYNLNKITQKVGAFLELSASFFAHNASEYDSGARYKAGDICYTVGERKGVRTYTWHVRVSSNPQFIQGVPPDETLHWEDMQESTSFDSLLPYSAPGYRHKFSIADLTGDGFDQEYYYPCVTDPFISSLSEKDIPARVLIEAFTQGPGFPSPETFRADLAVLAKFTGRGASSADVVLDQEYVRLTDGVIQSRDNNPIGYTKLPAGKRAVVWLKGGRKYALWNSFGVDFTLYNQTWTDEYGEEVSPSHSSRPFNIRPAVISARLETPGASRSSEAPNLSQVSGSLPLPIPLEGGESLRSLRRPGTYLAASPAVGDSLTDGPPAVGQLGICDITIKGDAAGLTMTIQQVIPRSNGNEYTRVLAVDVVLVDWYKSKSTTGLDIQGVEGLYVFDIDDAGHLVIHYDLSVPPPFSINESGNLIWNGEDAPHSLDLGKVLGNGIASSAVSYQKDTQGTTPPTGTWTESVPALAANDFLWTRLVLTFDSGSTQTVYTVAKSVKGDKGDTPQITFTYDEETGHLYYEVA